MWANSKLGSKGEVGAEHALEANRTCRGCRAQLDLRVLGKGEARYDDGDAVQARYDAQDRARADAALLGGLAPCPRCGTRDGGAVLRVIGHIAVRLVLAVMAVVAGSVIDSMINIGIIMVAGLVIAWCLLVSAVATNVRRFIGAKKRVAITVSEAGAPARMVSTHVGSKLEMQ